MKILIADDHPTNLRLLRAQLDAGGHNSVDAEDGIRALELLRSEPFDAVITDILMPNLDGYGLCLEIRRDADLRHLPLIIFTATYTSPADEKLAYDAGADRYLTKPAPLDTILTALEVVSQERKRTLPAPQSNKRRQEVMKEYNTQLILKIEQKSIELEQANAQLAAQVRRLAALREIDIAITASSDLEVTFNVLLEQVVSSLQVDAAAVSLFDPASHVLRFSAQRGFTGSDWADVSFRLGEGHTGTAALERRLVYVPDLRNGDPGNPKSDLYKREGFISMAAAPMIAKGELIGVLNIYLRSTDQKQADWLEFFRTLTGQAAIAVDSAKLFDKLQRSNLDLSLAYDKTIEGWSHALDLRDKETEGHTRRVTEQTLVLCRELGMDEGDLVHIRRGALLHDIGKMGVPDHILLKPGPLTDEEWEMMKQHPQLALELLSPIDFLRPALEIPYCHHEKWDGGGYPRGLREEQIPLTARIFAVVDVWDALTSDRPYRPAWTHEAALEYVRSQSGTHFDPHAVAAFLKLIGGEPA